MSAPTSPQVLRLYRHFIKAAYNWPDYNFSNYVLRIAREDFRKNKSVSDPKELEKLFTHGKQQLEIVQRQALISRLYTNSTSLLWKGHPQ